jgi:hypothetical protein
MTPKDALIEKMARAMWEATPPVIVGSDYVRPWDGLREAWREQYRIYARAAYEAEHEADPA